MSSKNKVSLHVNLSKELHQKLQTNAKQFGIPVCNYVSLKLSGFDIVPENDSGDID